MTIRLNKVTRDLNVGISTVVEFLQKKGYSIEANPNTKITEEQYAILVKEFSTDKNLKKESEKFIQERQNKDRNKVSISIEGYEEPKKEEVVKTVVPEDARPKFKPVGKIDLDNLNKKSVAPKVEEKTEEPEQIEVVVEKQPEPVKVVEEIAPVKEEKQPEPIKIIEEKQPESVKAADEQDAQEDGVYKIRSTEFKSKINVIGQIDLNALNQSTRPKKKSKEEKRKERDEKERIRQEQRKQMKDAIIKEIRKSDDKGVKGGDEA